MRRPSVLVAGGGPAGSVAAAILAKEGCAVTLVEKARHPRHHVGESLQPAAMELLDFHLGLGPLLAAQGYVRKYGALYEWGESRDRWGVLFDERLDDGMEGLTGEDLRRDDYVHSYQVERSHFDKLLLDHARERGARVLQETAALEPLLSGDRVVGLRVRGPDGERELRADHVIDATGQRCLLGRFFELGKPIPDLQATATYAYFAGAGGVGEPLNRDLQLIVTVPEGWIWFIPVGPDLTSIGVVTHEGKKIPEDRYWQILRGASLPLEEAHIVEHEGERFRHARDWTYSHTAFTGPGWLAVGDAACFTDPILSGGVDFAIRGACNAALAVLRSGSDDPRAGDAFAIYESQLQREFAAYLRLARYWYANNRAIEGLFWEMHRMIPVSALSTPLRAFTFLTSGECDADAHFHIFEQAQEQRIFQQLGVDGAQLRRALARAKRHRKLRRASKAPFADELQEGCSPPTEDPRSPRD